MNESISNPPPTIDAWEWQFQGLCRNQSPELFFHPEGERGSARRTRGEVAVDLCRQCPVLRQCRDHALAVPEMYGVWGGMTEEERRRVLANSTKPMQGLQAS